MARRERYTNPFAATGGHSPALYASMGVPIGTPIGISPYGNPMIGGFGMPVIQQPIQQPVYHQQREIYDPFGNDYPANAPISRSQYHKMQCMAPAYHTGERNWSSNPFDDGQYTYPNHASFETPQTRQYDRQMYRTYEDTRRTAHQNVRPIHNNIQEHKSFGSQINDNYKQKYDSFDDRKTYQPAYYNKQERQVRKKSSRSYRNESLMAADLSAREREYALNPDNYNNKWQYKDVIEKIKKGDEYHKQGEYELEGELHRQVQDDIIDKTDKFKKDQEAIDARTKNNLYVHSGNAIKFIEHKKRDFDDIFDLVGRRYYLTKQGKYFLDSEQFTYHKKGVSTIINPDIEY
jgi:hypothetical protein